MILIGLQGLSSVPITFLLFYGWLFVVPIGERLILKRKTWSDTLLQLGLGEKRNHILHGFYTGGLFFLSIVMAGYYFHPYVFDPSNLAHVLATWNFSGNLTGWLMLVLILVNPILEEIYWRGYVFTKLNGNMKTTHVVWITALFYSLYHFLSVIPLFNWPYNMLVMIPVFLAGMIWGYMRSTSNSVAGSIVSHILADAGIMAVYVWFLN